MARGCVRVRGVVRWTRNSLLDRVDKGSGCFTGPRGAILQGNVTKRVRTRFAITPTLKPEKKGGRAEGEKRVFL